MHYKIDYIHNQYLYFPQGILTIIKAIMFHRTYTFLWLLNSNDIHQLLKMY